MVEIRVIKQWKNKNPGDIVETNIESAENFVSQGFAEYVVKEKLVVEPNQTEQKKIYISSIINDKIIVEQVNVDGQNLFVVFNVDEQNWKQVVPPFIFEGEEYMPHQGEEIKKSVVHLTGLPQEYESEDKLNEEIIAFIDKWLNIDNDHKQHALLNIKRSWVYERFHTLNYLRALGDFGTGKSRYLETLGLLHYKPIITSGASTAAPIFRIIEKWKGTLLIDEGDFKFSDETQDIIKIINLGFEKGKALMRCNKNDPNKIEFFEPFGPKILATRRAFQDQATESRCFTKIMDGVTRPDIPVEVDDSFYREAHDLRCKLLLWRFRRFHKIDLEKAKKVDLGDLEPRIRQANQSFVALFADDEEQIKKFKAYLQDYQKQLVEERRGTFNGEILETLHKLI